MTIAICVTAVARDSLSAQERRLRPRQRARCRGKLQPRTGPGAELPNLAVMLPVVALVTAAAGALLHAPQLHVRARGPCMQAPQLHVRACGLCMQATTDESLVAKVQVGVKLFQESQAAGMGFKQAVADALAGEFDRTSVEAQVQEEAASAPLVLFTWASSPACKKALELLKETGATVKVVPLDAPWDEGNKKRAVLGRLTGKSSVPSCWIGGSYVGGCDDGPSEEAPGLVKLAFRGQLKEMLQSAGA